MLGEPTGALVEAGCQGTMRVRITLRGVRAHTARPFTGRNAIHRLAPLIERVATWEGREVVLDGCTYAEQLQVVAVEGGVAGNVVPDEARVALNHRYAPDRRHAEAEAFLHDLLDSTLEPAAGDTWEVLDAGDGAPPSLGHPLLRSLVEKSGSAPRAKVGWTDVASFWEHGVPAANFGPGDPLLAHHPDERVHACTAGAGPRRTARGHHLIGGGPARILRRATVCGREGWRARLAESRATARVRR